MYIMAPQAPAGSLTMQENFEVMRKRGNPFRVEMGMTPFALKGERGWNRDCLGKVTDIIRRMIEEGKVDAKRVYVIGMSMGGGGTINAVSTAPDLFAAALPICPSMNGESYPQLLHWPKAVSYTHLDVYKRQAKKCRAGAFYITGTKTSKYAAERKRLAESLKEQAVLVETEGEIMDFSEPMVLKKAIAWSVSYTHLAPSLHLRWNWRQLNCIQ